MAKQLDLSAFEMIKKQKEAGKNYTEIAEHLSKIGYVSVSGAKLSQAIVSQFACRNGMRVQIRRKKRTAAKQRATTARSAAPAKTDDKALEDFLLDVLAEKRLTTQQKLKVMKAL